MLQNANRNFYGPLLFLEESFINLEHDWTSAPLAVRGVCIPQMAGNIVADSEIILAGSSIKESRTSFGFSFMVANTCDTLPSRIAEGRNQPFAAVNGLTCSHYP